MRLTLRRVFIYSSSLLIWFGVGQGIALTGLNQPAQASYGFTDALGTVGIAAGIGTVMGLSTIAFYDSPTSHMRNVLIGAGAGLLVGIGVAAYLMTNSDDGNEIDPEELIRPKKQDSKKPVDKKSTQETKSIESKAKIAWHKSKWSSVSEALPQPVLAFSPDAREWIVGVQVLKLRF